MPRLVPDTRLDQKKMLGMHSPHWQRFATNKLLVGFTWFSPAHLPSRKCEGDCIQTRRGILHRVVSRMSGILSLGTSRGN